MILKIIFTAKGYGNQLMRLICVLDKSEEGLKYNDDKVKRIQFRYRCFTKILSF